MYKMKRLLLLKKGKESARKRDLFQLRIFTVYPFLVHTCFFYLNRWK